MPKTAKSKTAKTATENKVAKTVNKQTTKQEQLKFTRPVALYCALKRKPKTVRTAAALT